MFVTGPPGKGCGKLKIIDFGCASKMFKRNDKLFDVYGTSYYIAPEMLKRDYGLKADVWSIGVIYFSMLKGRMLYDGYSDFDIIKKIENDKPVFELEKDYFIDENFDFRSLKHEYMYKC